MASKKNDSVPSGACAFCRTRNEEDYGKFLHSSGYHFHEHCLFFSSGLSQTQDIDEGILGFSLEDIKKEIRRGQKLKCSFCKNNRATVGCCKNTCRINFHYPCGLKNRVLFQYYEHFRAYCKLHKPKQNKKAAPAGGLVCQICKSAGGDPESYLYASCCKNSWFHRQCLQEYASNAGAYCFKCPLCNNKDEFKSEMHFHGIYIPIKDASWELEENAYDELLFRPSCIAPSCKCPHGREYPGLGRWRLMTCETCGAQAQHRLCGDLSNDDNSWECDSCFAMDSVLTHPNIRRTSRTCPSSSHGETSSTTINPTAISMGTSLRGFTFTSSASTSSVAIQTEDSE